MGRIRRKQLVLAKESECKVCGTSISFKKSLCNKHREVYFEDKMKTRISLKDSIIKQKEKWDKDHKREMILVTT